ncbi:MAG TPA: hypothetical protein PK079_23275 [Leptospiraceae bacterium]|nr:hypothetical protein [Leptospiraceae bacterium]HMX31351.1 hypothetical protein [Leptospiraceae bacterium]HMY31606.1 hypothetical protein [Leptospiraceae bacterium]HMZ66128.1 hypothetical protein [Leptospiraceae bacterium]HNB97527.1 hypothetical protein [Leptospiraceae bacterium]
MNRIIFIKKVLVSTQTQNALFLKKNLKQIVNIFILSFCFLNLSFCIRQESRSSETPEPIAEEVKEAEYQPKEDNPSYNEQISCHTQDCIRLEYNKYSELDGKINDLMAENAGKILIKMLSYDKNLNHSELEPTVDYLREISKRDGRVSIEPYYIGHRDILSEIPFVKNIGLLGWDVYGRARDAVKYRFTKNYNAKVLYHPKHHSIMMIFFVHKNYGDVCNTIYSNCREVEYLDDDTFDLSLSTALKEATVKGQSVKVHFRQVKANLPTAKLDIENLKSMNQSARIFKWLVATKKAEKKSVKRDRFLGIEAVVTIIDYSIKLYDAIQKYKIYSPAFSTRAEVIYSGEETGGEIRSVVFYPEKNN